MIINNIANINFGGGGGESARLQEKSMTLSSATATIVPDEGYDGMTKVGVDATDYGQSKYNEGVSEQKAKLESISITSNGTYTKEDGYNNVEVNCPAPKEEQTMNVEYLTNGEHIINPDEGKVLSSVNVKINIPSGSTKYANGSVDVEGLRTIGWTDEDIQILQDNINIYPWQEDDWKLTDDEKTTYINNIPLYKDVIRFLPSGATLQNYIKLRGMPKLDTSNVTSMYQMFSYCSSLQSIPQLDTSNVTSMYQMFINCTTLQTIPQLDTSKVTSMYQMFFNCTTLQSIPQLDTSKVTSMRQMFFNCTTLQSIPQLDTSKVTSMNQMFSYCLLLQTIPQLDTSNVTDMNNMFFNCSSLQSIPQLDTSNVTSMNSMFSNCSSLQTIPQLDTSKVPSMNQMFSNCKLLQTIPQLDTSNVTDMNSMFFNCLSLQSIPQLDTSNVTSMNSMFYKCSSLQSITLNGSLNVNCDISSTKVLDYASVKSILTAASITTNTNAKTLKFNRTITDQDGELASLVSTCTEKGWTITGLTIE